MASLSCSGVSKVKKGGVPEKYTSLGRPLPLDEHACSVSFPRWADVVGYEEGDPVTHLALKVGYPRFKFHDSIDRLRKHMIAVFKLSRLDDASTATEEHMAHIGPMDTLSCMIWPTPPVAGRFTSFMEAGDGPVPVLTKSVGFGEMTVVYFQEEFMSKAKAFWQHCGEIVSSRRATAALHEFSIFVPDITPKFCTCGKRRHSKSDALEVDTDFLGRFCGEISLADMSPSDTLVERDRVLGTVRSRIGEMCNEPVENVLITVSGMAAIYTALRMAQAVFGGSDVSTGQIVVFGFPYIDTLKLCERKELNPAGSHFFGFGHAQDIVDLEALLRRPGTRIKALFTEFPSNPLLRCPDLRTLTRLAQEFDFILVVDDTIATYATVDLLHSPGVKVRFCHVVLIIIIIIIIIIIVVITIITITTIIIAMYHITSKLLLCKHCAAFLHFFAFFCMQSLLTIRVATTRHLTYPKQPKPKHNNK